LARYVDKPPFQEVDNGDIFQIYNSQDRENLNFCELEAHAPAIRLSPEAVQNAEIEITVFKADWERISHLVRNLVSPDFETDRLFVD
jgi:hypothetical protein